ncbi:NAD(P)H-binding protein [Nocardioides sp.]|uniref:NAD(P)H-binding protein n=1 Tax=Nocardioides sp. TaxID=35761 RepID=UPI002B275610|nr:NAD(P)H-binding protein [Nocardioides sp.]
MSKVLIIGAHGKIARLAATRLTAAGHDVAGVIRTSEQSDDLRADGTEPVVADVESLDVDALVDVVDGHDVVVWSAGAGGGSPERTYSVDRDAAIRTIDAASRSNASRFVMVSYFGAGPDHGVPPDNDFYAYAEAKTEADAHLAGSDLDWAILRPSALTDEDGTGGIETGEGVEASQVSRATVADVIAAVVSQPQATKHLTLHFNDGHQQVADVLGVDR